MQGPGNSRHIEDHGHQPDQPLRQSAGKPAQALFQIIPRRKLRPVRRKGSRGAGRGFLHRT